MINEQNEAKKVRMFFIKNSENCRSLAIVGILGFCIFLVSVIFLVTSYYHRLGTLDDYFGDYFGKYVHLSFDDYVDYIFRFNKLTGTEEMFYITFIISMILLSVGFIGTFICSLLIVLNNNKLVEKYNHSVLTLGIVSILFGIFTGLSLSKKIRHIIKTNDKINSQNYSLDKIESLSQPNTMKKYNSFSTNLNPYKPLNNINEEQAALIAGKLVNDQIINDQPIITKQEPAKTQTTTTINLKENDVQKTKTSNENNNVKLDIENLKNKLANLEHLRKEGLISDYEYFDLKEKIIVES